MKKMDHTAYLKKVRTMSSDSLLYVCKDCRDVLNAWPDHPNAGYYQDEIQYCGMELARRNRVQNVTTPDATSSFVNHLIKVCYGNQ